MKTLPHVVPIFFLNAVAQGSIFARIPDIQASLGLNDFELGMALLGQPVGAILSFLVSSLLVERFGTRLICLLGNPGMALAMIFIAMAPNLPLVFTGFVLFGLCFGVANVAINVEADRFEATGHRIMNTCHGTWSVGMLATTIFSTVMRGLDVAPALHFTLVFPVVLVGILLTAGRMQPAPPRGHGAAIGRHRIALPTVATLLLLGYMLGSSLLEGGLRNWSVIFMRDSFSAPEWVDTLTLPFFLVAQAAGRLLADRGVARWGAVRLARGLAITALIGLVLVIVSPHLLLALVGFSLIGLGVSVSFPLATSAAAQLGDRPASENVAALTMSQQVLVLGAPALLGLIAETGGIRVAFMALVPMLLLTIYQSRYLAPRQARDATN
ncbi:MFS transporter [Devosia sp.]|uniref:MFS transporter n=1 Tax=Devosia sp. TaxID=1871048 RepID=UPI003A951609